MYIGGHAEIGALDRNQMEEIAGEGWSKWKIGTDGIGKREN